MHLRNVLLIGGSGFIGSAIAARLSGAGVNVLVPTRRRERAKALILLPTVEVVEAQVHDEAQLAQLVRGMDAVINLVGVLHGSRGRHGEPYGPQFKQAHVDLPRKIAQACVNAGVPRLVHVSALGARADAPAMYLRSKAAGEAALMEFKDRLALTILRPSVCFGPDDQFLNLFAHLQAMMLFFPLGRAEAKLQPVYVEDVAQAAINVLTNPATFGQAYDIAGPRVYTLKELVQYAGAQSGHPRLVVALPEPLAYLQAWMMEWLPNPPLSRDNLDAVKVDNIMAGKVAPELGITPVALETIGPMYLSHQTPRDRYMQLRDHAGR